MMTASSRAASRTICRRSTKKSSTSSRRAGDAARRATASKRGCDESNHGSRRDDDAHGLHARERRLQGRRVGRRRRRRRGPARHRRGVRADEARVTLAKGRALIGISGWRYAHWRGVFYPKGLRQKDELAYASRAMDSIEVNGSFYGLLHASSVARWVAETPDGYTFAVKGSRFITHMKRLKDARPSLANFFAAGVLAFEDK